MKKIQLFCIPYAGGTAEAFDGIRKYLPEEIELTALDYAGHGTRRKEAYYPSFDDMAKDMAEQMNARIDKSLETAVFGYSMGSVVAYEMLAQGRVDADVSKLFFAAHEAPGEQWGSASYVRMDDLEFAHKLMEFGGFDRFEDRFLQNKYFRKMFFEPIREDYRLIADYRLKHDEKLSGDAVFFYAPQDVSAEAVRKWSARFEKEPEYIEIGRNHFFLKEYPEELAGLIAKHLQV